MRTLGFTSRSKPWKRCGWSDKGGDSVPHARASACRMYGLVLTRNVLIIRECFRSLYVFLTRECVHTS